MNTKMLTLVCGTLLLASTAFAGEKAHWGYTGENGPEHWGELDPTFHMCSEGKNQSPINLSGFIEAELPPIAYDYQPGGTEILNNGHAIQVNYKAGSSIAVNDDNFELKQFHFHSPSENTINGKSFPMEAHLVHADKNGNLAVVAIMFEVGKENEVLKQLWQQMPEKVGEKKELKEMVDVAGLIPQNRDYYRFNGSLTTPPCTEGVWWLVLKNPLEMSWQQLEEFGKAMHHPNNRPVQPVNARPVLQ